MYKYVFFTFVLVIWTLSVSAAEFNPPLHDCDRLAANTYDNGKLPEVAGIVHHKDIDYQKAIPACRSALSRHPGVARFQYQLGRALAASGEFNAAFEWVKKAAEQGHAAAYRGLAWAYKNGKGIPKDCAKEIEYWKKSAAGNHLPALHELGRIYGEGLCGVKKDWNQSAEYIIIAAKEGFPKSQNTLSVFYERGLGVQQNYSEALKWAVRAAVNGDKNAMIRLFKLLKQTVRSLMS